MVSMVETSMILQTSYTLYDVASWIHGVMALYTHHVRCLLSYNKSNKHSETVQRIDSAQETNPKLTDGPGTGRHQLPIVTAHAIEWNATLGHADAFPTEKWARGHLLAALRSFSPSFRRS